MNRRRSRSEWVFVAADANFIHVGGRDDARFGRTELANECLPLFSKLLQDYGDDPKIKSLIGKILANLSLHEDTHEAIFRAGWVGVLAAWKQDTTLLVTLPATKALCNLDQRYGDGLYRPGIYLLLPEHRTVKHLNELSNWGVDVVFIHGLLGGVFYTWRQLDEKNERGWGTHDLVSTDDYSYCWPRDWMQEFLGEDGGNVRVLGVDFDSFLSQWGNSCPKEGFKTSLAERSEEILQKLRTCGVGKRPVIFVGHSLGGLIVKRMLTQASASGREEDAEFVNNTRGVIFFGTPHAGSQVANLNTYTKYLFFPTTEVQELEAGSPQLADLQQSFQDLVASRTQRAAKEEQVGGGDGGAAVSSTKQMEVISFGETLATPYMGIDLTFVPPESSNPGVGQFYKVNMNHMNICKPSGRQSILFRKFKRMVLEALDEATPFE